MSNIPITPGSGAASVAGETVSGVTYQQIEVYGGGGASVLGINPDGSIKVSVIGVPTVTFSGAPSVSGTVGASVIGTVPVVQSGINISSISGVVTASVSGTAGASIIGQLPAGNAVLGAVAASISGTVLTTNTGSVIAIMAPVASFVSAVTSIITSTSLTSVLSAAGGSIKNYVTHILVTNGAATGTFVDVKDGGGNVIYSGYAAASGGGFSATINPPLVGSANKSVDVQPRAQASIIANMSGYTA